MLPTFVIGLREGLEAALIVGIIAAFLRKQGRGDLLRQTAIGVAAAVLICLLGGFALEIASRNLPQRQQEGLETVIGVLAVGMVTYMVVWMKEHSRDLKGQLEALTAGAIAVGEGDAGRNRAGMAMVAMAFLAVLREGFETVVFLLAAFNESGSGGSAVVGAVLGIVVAIGLGYGIYRGGVRINLSKFFRATGLVLVLVAGGLVVSALHTAHEAGWLDLGQHRMADLSWLVQPGSVLASLLTGMLGIQPYPVLAEVLGWLLYVIPLGLFVSWPPGRAVPLRALRMSLAGTTALGLGLAALFAGTAPTAGAISSVTRDAAAGISVQVIGHHDGDLVVRTQSPSPLAHSPLAQSPPLAQAPVAGVAGPSRTYTLAHTTSTLMAGVAVDGYAVTLSTPGTGPSPIATRELARFNDGRLPIGVQPRANRIPVRYVDDRVLTVGVEPRTDTVVTMAWKQTRHVLATGSSGQVISVTSPVAAAGYTLPASATHAALAGVDQGVADLTTRAQRQALAWLFGVLAATAGLGLLVSLVGRRTPEDDDRITDPSPSLIKT